MIKEFFTSFVVHYGWLLGSVIILLATFLVDFLETRIYRHLVPRLLKTQSAWDDTFLRAIHRPLRLVIWWMGCAFTARYLAYPLHHALLDTGLILGQKLGMTALLIWGLVRYVGQLKKHYMRRSQEEGFIDATTVQALSHLVRASLLVGGGLIVLQTCGVGLSGLLAFGGMSGLIAGLAAKDLLSNFFGGFMVFLDRPFKVGDWIRSPDKDIEGVVEHIGWRLTCIRRLDKRPLYVPNSLFSTIPLENVTRMTHRRIRTNIGLRYEDADKIPAIVAESEQLLRSHPDIDTSALILVHLVEYGSSSLDILVSAFTKTVDTAAFYCIQQDILLKVMEIVAKHGAQIAFSTLSLLLPENEAVDKGGAQLPPHMGARYSTDVMK